MKLRVIPILLMLVGIAGVVLYVTTPVITAKAQYVNEGVNTDFTQTFNVRFWGNGEIITFGDFHGSPIDYSTQVDKNDWDSQLIDVEPTNDVVVYLSFVGLGLAFLGMFLSIFGYSDGLRIAGALLAIIGGVLGIAGCFMLYNWNIAFQHECLLFAQVNAGFMGTSYTMTYSTFGLGWFAAVISSGLIAIGSVFLMFTKPK